MSQSINDKARSIWSNLDDNERGLVKAGLFPQDKMVAAQAEGFNGRALALALMQCAKGEGGQHDEA
jgi:hypothetical protein